MGSIKIINTNLKSISFDFPEDSFGKLELQVESESSILRPREKDNRTALLKLNLNIRETKNNNINISVAANVIFEFEEIPNDYNDVAKNECTPMACTELFKKIDDILVVMGYPKFNLKIKNNS